jgi:hypothetical protein
VRLSSSFNGRSKGESAPLPLALEYFDKPTLLPSEVLFGGGVRDSFDAGRIVDFVDFGVEMSIPSYPK